MSISDMIFFLKYIVTSTLKQTNPLMYYYNKKRKFSDYRSRLKLNIHNRVACISYKLCVCYTVV